MYGVPGLFNKRALWPIRLAKLASTPWKGMTKEWEGNWPVETWEGKPPGAAWRCALYGKIWSGSWLLYL